MPGSMSRKQGSCQVRARDKSASGSKFTLPSRTASQTKTGVLIGGDLLLAIEDSLCLLNQTKGAILEAALDLHRLSNGEIGMLKDMLQIAGNHAIEEGDEALDLAEFSRKVAQLQKQKQVHLAG